MRILLIEDDELLGEGTKAGLVQQGLTVDWVRTRAKADYVVKPFDLDEICARIRALRRRSTGRPTPQIHHGDMTLDPAAHKLTLAGAAVHLPPKEFTVLHMLLEHAGETVPRRRLVSRLYGWGGDADSNPLDV